MRQACEGRCLEKCPDPSDGPNRKLREDGCFKNPENHEIYRLALAISKSRDDNL